MSPLRTKITKVVSVKTKVILKTRVEDESPASRTFGPGGLRAPPQVAHGRQTGHCFQLLFGPGVLACATLSFHLLFSFFFLSSPPSTFHEPVPTPSPWSIFFLHLRLLLLTHYGESPVCENLFPPIFWHN